MKQTGRVVALIIISGCAIGLDSCSKEKVDKNTLVDIEGNVYHSVTIGEQVWMTENLKTTKLNDGTSIENITNDSEWGFSLTPTYCWADNDEVVAAEKDYGILYNWYAIETEKLCPEGWHVPTLDELDELFTYLGDPHDGARALKATSGWGNEYNGTDIYGFSALPGGTRDFEFMDIGKTANWWSSTKVVDEGDPDKRYDFAWHLCIMNSPARPSNPSYAYINTQPWSHGMSIRCIKD